MAARELPSPIRRFVPVAIVVAGAALIWLLFGHGFANYDTFYSLVWGNEIFNGLKPDYGAPIPPTPHPLQTLQGVLLAPFGDGAEPITVAIAFLSLAAVAYFAYRLGQLWFGVPAGLVAAAVVLTREPILSNGVRAYVDLPYIALVLAALVVETKRPKAGWPVLALLALAGLLRPEAWLFSFAYLAYLAYTRFAPSTIAALRAAHRSRSGLVQVVAPTRRDRVNRVLLSIAHAVRQPPFLALAALAAAGPVIWVLYDVVFAGNALYSLTGTQDTVQTLGRDTGIVDWVRFFPRRLGEILREPVLLGAAGGGVLTLWLLRDRAKLGAAAGFLAAGAFALLAFAGLAVITRYAMLAAVILAIFCGAGVFGWVKLPEDHPRRRWWMAFGALVAVTFVVFAPGQHDRLERLQDSIATQEEIRDDLEEIADSDAIEAGCEPVTVPNHRPVPLLALWLERRPSQIVTAVEESGGELVRIEPESGYYFDPASAVVEENFTLDPNDPGELTAPVPAGFERVEENESWVLYARC
ncbi:MAG: hypothetical protein ACR2OC_01320 [Solirubrobacterales bacterium]